MTCLEELMETTKSSVRLDGVGFKIWTRDLKSTVLKFCLQYSKFQCVNFWKLYF